jgi:hypothetical protein
VSVQTGQPKHHFIAASYSQTNSNQLQGQSKASNKHQGQTSKQQTKFKQAGQKSRASKQGKLNYDQSSQDQAKSNTQNAFKTIVEV